MPDTYCRRHPSSRDAGTAFELQAEVVLTTRPQQPAIQDALRLLATWSVRAARTHKLPQNGLDCSSPGSDECTPNRSTGEDGDHTSEETS